MLPPPLPTAEGVYLDDDGDVWRIHRPGEPLVYLGEGGGDLDPAGFGPFTRLVPVAAGT